VEVALETDCLRDWIVKLFPPRQGPLPWDTERLLLNENLPDFCVFCKSNDFKQNTAIQKWISVDIDQPLRQVFNYPGYVIPKYPVFFLLHKSYKERFLDLDISKIK
jgi:hypothetical protein